MRSRRPQHSYLTETECRQLDNLVRHAAQYLEPRDCNRLLVLFEHHSTDLKRARATNAGLQQQISSLRQQRRSAEQQACGGTGGESGN